MLSICVIRSDECIIQLWIFFFNSSCRDIICPCWADGKFQLENHTASIWLGVIGVIVVSSIISKSSYYLIISRAHSSTLNQSDSGQQIITRIGSCAKRIKTHDWMNSSKVQATVDWEKNTHSKFINLFKHWMSDDFTRMTKLCCATCVKRAMQKEEKWCTDLLAMNGMKESLFLAHTCRRRNSQNPQIQWRNGTYELSQWCQSTHPNQFIRSNWNGDWNWKPKTWIDNLCLLFLFNHSGCVLFIHVFRVYFLIIFRFEWNLFRCSWCSLNAW